MADDSQTAKNDSRDLLASSLERASNILITLGSMFDTAKEQFAVSNSYIMHSVVAASELITNAQAASQAQTYFESVDDAKIFADETDDLVLVFNSTSPPEQEPQADKTTEVDDTIAQTYDEFLRKLTAAEVFATEQQALAPPGATEELLPLLRSLREEFEKLRTAA
jgi:hypothetical protein